MFNTDENSIENIILDEKFDRFVFTTPFKEDDRKLAIEYYKMFKDYGCRQFPLTYSHQKDFIRLLYELEDTDIIKAKKDIDSVQRDSKSIRLIIEDKFYLEESIRQTNNSRLETNVLDICWRLKGQFNLLEERCKLLNVITDDPKNNNPVLKTINIKLGVYGDVINPIRHGVTLFGEDYTYSMQWFDAITDCIRNALKIPFIVNKDPMFVNITNNIQDIFLELKQTILPYYKRIKKANETFTVTIKDKITRLEINTTPQFTVNKNSPYSWHIMVLNNQSIQWEYTNIGGWQPTTHLCFEEYYLELYKLYLRHEVERLNDL